MNLRKKKNCSFEVNSHKMRKMQKLRVDAATHLHEALKDLQSYAETSEVY